MGYVVFLLFGLASLITLTISNPFGALTKIKTSALDAILPHSEEEVLIESLKSNYPDIELFFVEAARLMPKAATQQQKETLNKAAEAFLESKKLLAELEKTEEKNRPGIIQTLVKKILTDSPKSIEPTAIPPRCRLECPAK